VKKRIRSILTLGLTVVLLYLVVRKVGLGDLVDTIRGADPFWMILSILISPLLNLTSVIKWKQLLASQDIKVSTVRLFALYLVGRFFNYFLPSNVGGDVVRGYVLGKHTNQGAQAMASVFMERFTGFVLLVVFAVVASATNLDIIRATGLAPAVGLAVLALAGVLWLILDSRPLDLFERVVRFRFAQKSIKKLRKFHTSINAYRKERKVLALAMFWSTIFMALAIMNVYTSARTFGEPVDLAEVSVITPIILCVAMIPITVNGLGIQEWAYVLLFSMVGMPESLGLSTILFIRVKDVALALIGGLLYPIVTAEGDKSGLPKSAGEEGLLEEQAVPEKV
jgi:uncharacterized protein (TIRG00374 family)